MAILWAALWRGPHAKKPMALVNKSVRVWSPTNSCVNDLGSGDSEVCQQHVRGLGSGWSQSSLEVTATQPILHPILG